MKSKAKPEKLPPPFEQKQPRKPMRMCVACRVRKEKKDLIRIAKNDQGIWSIDSTKTMQRRGAYVCPLEACKMKAKKNKQYSTIDL